MVGIVYGGVGLSDAVSMFVDGRLLHQPVAQFANLRSTTDCVVARVEHLELERRALLKRGAELLCQPQFGGFAPCVLEQILVAHDCDTTKLVP